MKRVCIKGIGTAVPEKVLTNDDLSKIVDTSDEWIYPRTGMKKRHMVTDQTATDLAELAGAAAIKDAGIDPSQVDLVIVSTATPDYTTPSVAAMLKARLGLGHGPAFDISAACTGSVYILEGAQAMMASQGYKCALVISVELLTRHTDWSDRSTCVLFGDAAGAYILQPCEKGGIEATWLNAKSDSDLTLSVPVIYPENPYIGYKHTHEYLRMDGGEVFKFATGAMIESIKEVTKKAGKTLEDIDHVIPHQANIRIINNTIRRMKLPKEKVYVNIHEYANTGSASISLALHEMREKGMLKNGDSIVLSSFGGGFTWGAAWLTWNE